MNERPVYIIDGSRTPFLKARGIGPFTPVDLAVQCGRPLLLRQPFAPDAFDKVILGCVNVIADEMNPARVAALRLGMGEAMSAFTVQINCGSGMQSIETGYRDIQDGVSDLILAGGTEALSYAPLVFRRSAVEWYMQLFAARNVWSRLKAFASVRPSFFKPIIGLERGLTDPIVELNMGQTAEVVAHLFNVTRRDADQYAAESQQRLARAQKDKVFAGEMEPAFGRDGKVYDYDDGVRPDSTADSLAKLKPVFERPWGQVTAGNSSQITDGASWVILASENAVKKHDLTPRAVIVDSEWSALDPSIMGLGPVLCSTAILRRQKLALNDIDLWELNEAFAAQVLGCVAAWQDDKFCREVLHLDGPAGVVDHDKLNIDGGAIGLGHPVGASGNRIVLHLVNAMKRLGRKREGAKASSPWRHWKLKTDEDGIAWLVLDKQGAGANTLSEDVISELDDVLATIERKTPKGLVIRSGKPGGFIAGADIGEFRDTTKTADIEARLGRAHTIIDRLDRLKLPTIAVIHGYCLGGGLEVVLACDYRIAVDDASLGFPEVLLGLHPGLGGTVRLTRLINPLQAMTSMLTGKSIYAQRAKALGLVDAVTQERHVHAAVKAAVAGQLKTARAGLSVTTLNLLPARKLLAPRMKIEAEKKAPAKNYPAPSALIDLWETNGGSRAAMQKAEVASFARLLVTPTAQNLIRVFFLRDKLKSLSDGDWKGRRIHVIGAGAMGGDIAAWCAWHGFTVSLADMKAEPLAGAVKRAADLFKIIGHKSTDIRDALDRLIPDLKGDGSSTADLIIEAVPETLELKQKVYAGVEARMRPDAILATNTSSIPLEELRKGLKRPERFLGLHFFNPVSRMQLVEVVSHDGVAADVLAAGQAFLGHIDRLPAPVKSAPGFLVNRALTPYLMEAFVMLDEGIKRETIDRAAEDFGMPMGPIELADQVGLDICLHVADVLRKELRRPMPATPKWLSDKVEKGELGRKTGKGMYEWKDGKAVKDSGAPAPCADLADRLILQMLDVCVTCLHEQVVADEDTIDGAMIFGTGFAPFRGGPMHYARSRGVIAIRQALEQLAAKYGERFRPDPGWDRLK